MIGGEAVGRLGREGIAGPALTFAGRSVAHKAIAHLTFRFVGLQPVPGGLGLTDGLLVEDLRGSPSTIPSRSGMEGVMYVSTIHAHM